MRPQGSPPALGNAILALTGAFHNLTLIFYKNEQGSCLVFGFFIWFYKRIGMMTYLTPSSSLLVIRQGLLPSAMCSWTLSPLMVAMASMR